MAETDKLCYESFQKKIACILSALEIGKNHQGWIHKPFRKKGGDEMKKVLLPILTLFFVLFYSTQGVFAADAWRIGTIFPLTGPNAKNGTKNFDGVKIATEMINDAGGVLGKKVVLVSADAPDPQAAASEANRLITNEKITAIMGTQSSSLSMAATVVAEKNKIFYLENGKPLPTPQNLRPKPYYPINGTSAGNGKENPQQKPPFF